MDDAFPSGISIREIIDKVVDSAAFYHDLEFNRIQNGESPSKEFANYRAVKQDQNNIKQTINDFYKLFIEEPNIVYLPANSIKQSALFSIRDRNNILAQCIHEYYQLKLAPGEEARVFIEKSMKMLAVGDAFEINLYAGEAYQVSIKVGKAKVHLADMGLGSIQIMLLLFRLALVIHNYDKTLPLKTTIIIEEPELNLHPALQSKLADLFLELYEKYALSFIVETHSEYIIRRSQVLVAEREYEIAPNENPFNIYYFPRDIEQSPYKLGYNEDGSFKRNFGEGFFDEASSSTLELLKLKRQKKP